ncbi:MAG: LTA synthase family protein, partial [Pseudomonadales bacterium]|nr:LTA synthase family protein [Pseudomonadales bacterium]
EHQLTEVNLLRFHIPVLIYGKIPPSLQGRRLDTVISQVDVIPTLSGLMGEPVTAGCWGRDVFATRPDDAGQAVIKPSGGEQVVAYVQGDRLVTLDESGGGHLYEYDLAEPAVQRLEQPEVMAYMVNRLLSYVQTGINYLNQKPVIPGKQESAD